MNRESNAGFEIPNTLWGQAISWLFRVATESSAKRRIPRRPWLYSVLLVAMDGITWSGLYLALSTFFGIHNVYGSADILIPTVTVVSVLGLIGGYNPRRKMASLKYATEHIIACLFGSIISAFLLYLVVAFGGGIASSRGTFAASFVGSAILSLFYRRYLWFALSHYGPKRSLLVIGDADLRSKFYSDYTTHANERELFIVATDDRLVGEPVAGPDSPIFAASSAELPKILHNHPENRYEAVVVAADGENLSNEVLGLLATVHFQTMPVYSLTSYYETYWEKMPIHLLSATWPLQAGFHLVKHSVFASAKRVTDVLMALLLLIVMAPLMIVLAILIPLDTPGAALFRQTRIGQHRRPFTIFKFRTMVVGSDKLGMYTAQNDSRVTRLGRLLRKFRLDELPQLINVLRGDMSLIGPRAEWIKCVERYEKIIPHYHFRHLVRPGITGWAQVNYPYGANDKDTIEKLMYDLYYIRNFSLNLDAAVILKTLHVMLFGKGQ